MHACRYDTKPVVDVPGSADSCQSGWPEIARRLREAVAARGNCRTILTLDCYPGVDAASILREFARWLEPAVLIDPAEALRREPHVDRLIAPFLGGDDPVFGFLSNLSLADFFDPARLAALRSRAHACESGLVLIVGCGAALVDPGDVLIYADLSRWEAQLRFRRNASANLGSSDTQHPASLQYKRAFFIDWRVCDRHKRQLLPRSDFVLDTNDAQSPKLADGPTVRRGLQHAAGRPFRVVPFFDPAPWGGQWMKQSFGLDPSASNYGWCFDCVPEENSLLLGLGNTQLELPALDLVFQEPERLLGPAVFGRFGAEFPIRFDFLDTIGGGNLSFQVHPLTQYIQEHFGLHYTQDESYYLLDAEPDASVYLGFRKGVDLDLVTRELRLAQQGTRPFVPQHHVNRWPARKHDHFLIPAGTCHCSGAGSMVLEISATPYIFTFKLWDWGRLGLDGKRRPIHLEHGLANLDWTRDTSWVEANLINHIQPVSSGPGWREEATGLHERQFIETRRHWFTGPVPHDQRNSVNVLNLVEGDEALVESPDGRFAPFPIRYAETFIVPAAAGPYTIRPLVAKPSQPMATIKACVRHSA